MRSSLFNLLSGLLADLCFKYTSFTNGIHRSIADPRLQGCFKLLYALKRLVGDVYGVGDRLVWTGRNNIQSLSEAVAYGAAEVADYSLQGQCWVWIT